jgi:hypothetical protein
MWNPSVSPRVAVVIILGCCIGFSAAAEPEKPIKDGKESKVVNLQSLQRYYELRHKRDGKVQVKEYVPGYYDDDSETFYALKGIVFTEWPDPISPYRRPHILTDQDKYKRVEVDLPIAYHCVEKGTYTPGSYLSIGGGIFGTFYRWKGITLTTAELPEKDPKHPFTVLPERPQWHKFYEVDPPKHFLEKPELWKKVKKADSK